LKQLFVAFVLIFSSIGVGLGTFTYISQGASDSDGVLVIDTRVVASGTYNIVRVSGTGTLVIETSLEASQLILEPGSSLEITGGTLTITDSDTPGARIFISGSVDNFKMTQGAKIIMIGSTGSSSVNQSAGGDVDFNIIVRSSLVLDNSEINLEGGKGYSKPTPGADAKFDLMNYQYAGGNATVVLELSPTCTQSFQSSTINVLGGTGGKASDGESASLISFGKGGGYTNGGSVGGYVGSGGSAALKINYHQALDFDEMNITVLGGTGGKSGDGSYLTTEYGGGGGGYTGGDGGQYIFAEPEKAHGKPGGNVSGYVGTGGNASFEILTNSSIDFQDSSIAVHGGFGGDAGPHKSASMQVLMGGMGSFGYGGGGGGGGYTNPGAPILTKGGSGGNVSGHAGSGGSADILLDAKGYLTLVDSSFNLSGGRGGRAGNGTQGKEGGGGGGGFGGGGGGGGALLNSVNVTSIGGSGGDVSGNVGTGGDSNLMLISSFDIRLWTSTLLSQGGSGSAAGAGAPVNTIDAGGGGGGYGGGGGGGKNGEWTGGTGGMGGRISNFVGSGGSANFNFSTSGALDVLDSVMIGKGGDGGTPGSGGQYNAGIGGGGGGGYGGGGGGGGSNLHIGGFGGASLVDSGNAGSGGDIDYIFNAAEYSISRDSVILAFEGDGVSSSNNPGLSGGPKSSGYGEGGSGDGQNGIPGSKELEIPMGIPRLIAPEDASALSFNLPTFSWIPQHNSTMFGSLTGHRLEVDTMSDFTTPVVISYTQDGSYILINPLQDGLYYWRVRAEYSGDTAGWSEIRSFVIDTTPVFFSDLTDHSWKNTLTPNCTINIGDEHTAVDLSSIQYSYSTSGTFPASFSPWLEADGINDTSGDGSFIETWAYPELKKGSNNFIKWRALDIVGNGYTESLAMNIRIDLDSPIVNAFAPSDHSWSYETRPVFKWAGIDIGSGLSGNISFRLFKYEINGSLPDQPELQINGSMEFNSSDIFEFNQPTDLEYGKYCWDIQVEDRAGLWSAYSDKMTFHVDTVSPVVSGRMPVGAEWVSDRPIFSWDAVDTYAGIDSKFFLELAKDKDFLKLVYKVEGSDSDLISIDGNTYTYDWQTEEPLEGGTWFWRVKVMGNEGLWSDYSTPLEFQVDSTTPLVVPESPLNGSWSNGGTELSWSASDGESGLNGRYRIFVSEEREFIKPVIDQIVDSNDVSISSDSDVALIKVEGSRSNVNITYMITTELYRNVYYWRVSAEDEVGLWSSPSDIFEFKIDLDNPQVTPVSPDQGSWAGSSLRFQWTAEDELSGLAGEYHFQVASSNDFNFDSILIGTTLAGPEQNNVMMEYSPETNLPETELFWRISARDKAGNWCPFSPERSFRLDLTGVQFNPITEIEWFNSKNVSFEIEITDTGSGVDFENIYYRTSRTGVATYGPWQHIQSADLDLMGSNKVSTTVSFTTREGFGNYIQFKARDLVNNAFQESPNIMLSVDLSPVRYSDATPLSDSWQERNVVTCSVSINDMHSGVDTTTLEYRSSVEGLDNFGDWIPYVNSYESMPGGEVVVSTDVAFSEGEENYIQWRVKDNAGNGYFVSEPHQVKIRTNLEDEHSERMDPRVDRDTDDGWGMLSSNSLIYLCNLFVIMIVFVVIMGILIRQRKRKYEDEEDLNGNTKFNLFSKGFDRGLNDEKLPSTGTSSRNDTTRYIIKKNGSDSADLEEIMDALDHELEGKFKSKNELNEPLANRSVINIPPSTLAGRKSSIRASREINMRKAGLSKGSGGQISSGAGNKSKKKRSKIRCEICKGNFKSEIIPKECTCGGLYHQSCAKRRGLCPVCRKRL
jgi:hypothetical protein